MNTPSAANHMSGGSDAPIQATSSRGSNVPQNAIPASVFLKPQQAAAVQMASSVPTRAPYSPQFFPPHNFQNVEIHSMYPCIRPVAPSNAPIAAQLGLYGVQIPQFLPIQNVLGSNMLHHTCGAAGIVPISLEDEMFLVEKLRTSIGTDQLRSEVIGTLGGVRNHTEMQWKDYYIDNYQRIHDHIASLNRSADLASSGVAPSQNVGQRGQPSSNRVPVYREGNGEASGSSNREFRPSDSQQLATTSHPGQPQRQPAPTSVRLPRLPAHPSHSSTRIHHSSTRRPLPLPRFVNANSIQRHRSEAHIALDLPAPPTHLPAPPPGSFSQQRRSCSRRAYTDADKQFFVASLMWYLERDPVLTKSTLAAKLNAKAPHHSQGSWRSHMQSHSELVDRIYAWARKRAEELAADEQSHSRVRRDHAPIRLPAHTKGNGEAPGPSRTPIAHPSTEDDVPNIHENSGQYVDTDMDILAKYIASVPDWHSRSYLEQWSEFARKYPRRTLRSWAKYYDGQTAAINTLSRKYRRNQKKSTSNVEDVRERIHTSRSNSLKRKADPEPDDEAPSTKRRHSPVVRDIHLGHVSENEAAEATPPQTSAKGKGREVPDAVILQREQAAIGQDIQPGYIAMTSGPQISRNGKQREVIDVVDLTILRPVDDDDNW